MALCDPCRIMMKRMSQRISRRSMIGAAAASGLAAQVRVGAAAETDREYWTRTLRKVADPLLNALSQRRLKIEMPVEAAPRVTDRPNYTHLEALGRLLSGMAPWIESGDSGRYAELARAGIAAAVDPSSPDLMNFSQGSQPVVDAAF